MNIEQVGAVLAKVQLGDNRKIEPEDRPQLIREWEEYIGDLPFEMAMEAVTVHRRESTEYLQPAHIVRNVKRIRERLSLESAASECSEHWGYPLPCARCVRDAEVQS